MSGEHAATKSRVQAGGQAAVWLAALALAGAAGAWLVWSTVGAPATVGGFVAVALVAGLGSAGVLAWQAGYRRGANRAKQEYQELAQAHVEAHERFEQAIGRLRDKHERVERSYAYEHQLLSAYEAIADARESLSIHETVIDAAARLVPADSAVFFGVNAEEGKLSVQAVRGVFDAWRLGGTVSMEEGFVGWVARYGQATAISDLAAERRFIPSEQEGWFRSLLGVPISVDGRVVGVIALGRADEPDLTSDDLWLLSRLAAQGAVALDRDQAHVALDRLARTDGLTGLFNRREFDQRLEAEFSRAERYGAPLTLLMMDIDHFKHFNDHNGHPMGDKLLQEVSRILKISVREVDIAARYGGEEFVVILPQTGVEAALPVAERIRNTVAGLNVPGGSTQPLGHLSLSLGLASFPEHAATAEVLLKQADRALYEAKSAGRDRCQACKDFLAG